MTWSPACMDEDELERFRAGVLTGCRDCTEAFALDMRAVGRCNGVPGEVLAGIVKEDPVDEPVQIAGKRVPVEVSLPCGSCAHQPVCRIAPALAALDQVAVALPTLDGAVTLSLSASASCGYYVRAKKSTSVDSLAGVPGPMAGRKLNLSDEERERRRQQALANVAAQRARREAVTA